MKTTLSLPRLLITLFLLGSATQSHSFEFSNKSVLLALFSGALISTVVYHRFFNECATPSANQSICSTEEGNNTDTTTDSHESTIQATSDTQTIDSVAEPLDKKKEPKKPTTEDTFNDAQLRDQLYTAGDLFNS